VNSDNAEPKPKKQPKKELTITMPDTMGAPHRAGGLLTFLALILAILACAAVAWLGWQGRNITGDIVSGQERFKSGQERLKSDQLTVQRQYSDLKGRLEQINSRLWKSGSDTDGELARIDRVLRSHNNKLSDLSAADRADWQLAEVEYLLRLANQRLLMARETRGARALLEAADQILLELDEMALHPVRRAVAEDLAALRAVAEIDIEGIYLRLEALAQQVAKLPMYEVPEMKGQPMSEKDNAVFNPVASGTEPEDWLTSLQSVWYTNWKAIQKYVVIQHRDEIVQPLPSKQTQELIQQRLQALIEEAQLALLKSQQTIYSDNLNKAIALLKEYYEFNRVSTMAAITTLQELNELRLVNELPDISGSLKEVKTYIETIHNLTPAPVASSNKVLPSKTTTPPAAKPNKDKPVELTVTKEKASSKEAPPNKSAPPAIKPDKDKPVEPVETEEKASTNKAQLNKSVPAAKKPNKDKPKEPTTSEEKASLKPGVTQS